MSRIGTAATALQDSVEQSSDYYDDAAPQYVFTLDGVALANGLNSMRSEIYRVVDELNADVPDGAVIRERFEWLETSLHVSDVLLSDQGLSSAVGLSADTRFRVDEDEIEACRLTMPIQNVFASRVNLTVLGEAGSGKTTSLQMCAADRLEHRPDALTVFVPLVRATKAWEESGSIQESDCPQFESVMAAFLSAQSVEVSCEQLRTSLADSRSTALLDGVDEAIERFPWLRRRSELTYPLRLFLCG
jgi:hypothetical protein